MYNFDERIERKGTNSLKLEGYQGYIFGKDKVTIPCNESELIHLWVADMDFAVADCILDSIRARLDQKILGYTLLYDDKYKDAFTKWCMDMYGWEVDPKHVHTSPGVVHALDDLVEIITKSDEKVLINTPAYGPFYGAAKKHKRECIYSPLVCNDGHFEMDWEDFEEKAKAAKIYIFCNPHNPTGRMWTEEELERLAKIVKKNNLWVISDEIHCDLVRSGSKHIPLSKVMEDYERIVTCMAPSKTFNLAGLQMANVIIKKATVAKKWQKKNWESINPLSLAGAQAAYEKGYDWLVELRKYLDGNFEMMKEFLNENLPEAGFEMPEATYLAWIDLSAYFDKNENIAKFFTEKAGVIVEGAANFVRDGEGYVRINAACPREVLKEGLERMVKAIKER